MSKTEMFLVPLGIWSSATENYIQNLITCNNINNQLDATMTIY